MIVNHDGLAPAHRNALGQAGRILVADDDDAFLESTTRLISSYGFEVESVRTGNEMLAVLERGWADVVIADVNMPGNKNLECLEQIQGATSEVGLILVTGYPSVETATRSFGLGATNYLVKPFEDDALLKSIHSALEGVTASRRIVRIRDRLGALDRDLEVVGKSRVVTPRTEAGDSTSLVLDLVFDGVIGILLDLKDEMQTGSTRESAEGANLENLQSSLLDVAGVAFHAKPELRSLSPREREVLFSLVSGNRVSTIARDLFISENTVRNHLKSIFHKVGVRSQVELLEYFRHGNDELSDKA